MDGASDSEEHTLTVGCLLRTALGGTTLGSEGNRIRQGQKVNHAAVTLGASHAPAGSSRAEVALQHCPMSWQGTRPLNSCTNPSPDVGCSGNVL